MHTKTRMSQRRKGNDKHSPHLQQRVTTLTNNEKTNTLPRKHPILDFNKFQRDHKRLWDPTNIVLNFTIILSTYSRITKPHTNQKGITSMHAFPRWITTTFTVKNVAGTIWNHSLARLTGKYILKDKSTSEILEIIYDLTLDATKENIPLCKEPSPIRFQSKNECT